MRSRFTLSALAASALALATSAQAAVPTEVTGAISDMKTDGTAVAVAVLVAIIAVMAVKFIRKGM